MAQAIVSPENLELAVEEIKEYIDGKVDSGKSNNIKLRFKSRPILVEESEYAAKNVPRETIRQMSDYSFYSPDNFLYAILQEAENPLDYFETTESYDQEIYFDLENDQTSILYILIPIPEYYTPAFASDFVLNNFFIKVKDIYDSEYTIKFPGTVEVNNSSFWLRVVYLNFPISDVVSVQLLPILYFEGKYKFLFVSDSALCIADESGYINTHKDSYVYIERWSSKKRRWTTFMASRGGSLGPIKVRDLEDLSLNMYPNEYKYYLLPYTALSFIQTLKHKNTSSTLLLRIGIADSFEDNTLINKSEPIYIKVRGELKPIEFSIDDREQISGKVNQIRFTTITSMLKKCN